MSMLVILALFLKNDFPPQLQDEIWAWPGNEAMFIPLASYMCQRTISIPTSKLRDTAISALRSSHCDWAQGSDRLAAAVVAMVTLL